MHIDAFKLERFFARYEFTAPYLLCASDCEALGLKELLALEPAAAKRMESLRLGYTEAAGSEALRRLIADLYDLIAPDDVLVHAGSSEAIFSFMNCILSAGDHIIVQTPAYQSHYEVARAIGCTISPWAADESKAWAPDLETLERSVTRATKAIMVTVPHNPTGYLMPRQTQSALIELARKHNLWLFSDEIFRFLEYDPGTRPPAAADLYERAVSLGGLSKSFGLAGVRVGWVATRNRELLEQMARFKDYLSLCNGASDELLAGIALKHRATLHERNVQMIRDNLQLFADFVARHATMFSWRPPAAATVGLVRYGGAEGSAKFCAELVARSGVLLLPSAVLDFGDQHFRVGLGRRNAPEAIARFDEFLTLPPVM